MLALLNAGSSFTPAATPPASVSAVRSAAPVMISEETSRRAVLAGVLGVGIGSFASPVSAGYVTSLGIETTAPKDADVDDELFATKPVQESLARLKKAKAAGQALKATFAKDTNANLIPAIRKDFDFAALRNDLNVVSTIFDDQTQVTTSSPLTASSSSPSRPLSSPSLTSSLASPSLTSHPLASCARS